LDKLRETRATKNILMERQVITADGNYTFSCPIGATFSFAVSGTTGGAVIEAQYNSGMTVTAGTGTLDVTGVVIHGETVTIGGDVYQFAADADQTVEAGNIAVDLTAVATASQGTLTLVAQPAANETITIGARTYTYVTGGAGVGEISRGVDLAAAKVNTVSAINGIDGVNFNNDAYCADAFVGNDLVITAKVAGTAGDTIPTTETLANVGNIFDAVTLGTTTAGVDCTAADAITALVAADAGASYTLAAGAGDTIVVTGNGGFDDSLIATIEDMANASFEFETLTGGTEAIDRWKDYTTTEIKLSNTAGEKTGVNVGAHNEINLAVSSSTGTTNMVVVFNVLP
jgi:hypothetical protein